MIAIPEVAMFGMLDYRASKLFWLIFGVPYLALYFIPVLLLPFLAYLLGYRYIDNALLSFFAALVLLFLIEIVWIFLHMGLSKLFQFLFAILIDVIPHDGRSKDQAMAVVIGGELQILFQEFEKHPSEWRDNLAEEFLAHDWRSRWVFSNEIKNRFNAVKKHFTFDEPEAEYDEFARDFFIQESGLGMTAKEKLFTFPYLISWSFGYGFFLFLSLVNPFNI
ncbi:MAG: hypothetical protein P8N92_08435 [Burkholderiales bacterium]|nr:hypothetical protein [Burkholderiales bacterium]